MLKQFRKISEQIKCTLYSLLSLYVEAKCLKFSLDSYLFIRANNYKWLKQVILTWLKLILAFCLPNRNETMTNMLKQSRVNG